MQIYKCSPIYCLTAPVRLYGTGSSVPARNCFHVLSPDNSEWPCCSVFMETDGFLLLNIRQISVYTFDICGQTVQLRGKMIGCFLSPHLNKEISRKQDQIKTLLWAGFGGRSKRWQSSVHSWWLNHLTGILWKCITVATGNGLMSAKC